MMNVGHAACDRILDRDHAEVRIALGDRGEGILERRAGDGLGVGIGLMDRQVRIGARFALECDLMLGHGRFVSPIRGIRVNARS